MGRFAVNVKSICNVFLKKNVFFTVTLQQCIKKSIEMPMQKVCNCFTVKLHIFYCKILLFFYFVLPSLPPPVRIY